MIHARARAVFQFPHPPRIISYASVVGQKEGEGPFGSCFDHVEEDAHFGQKTWEQAESALQQQTVRLALKKCALTDGDITCICAGDLINQCTGSTYGLRPLEIPFLGIYGACSTMAEGLLTASLLASAGIGEYTAAVTSSHFSTAERQFRFPLAYGGQRPPTAQWTCTASGAVILQQPDGVPDGICVTGGCIGKIVDLGVTDASNMGAAMAPAAISTLQAHFRDLRRVPSDYDLIVTGDLGMLGRTIVLDQFRRIGVDLSPVYNDCGLLIFDTKSQDVHAGGSGCGCGASVLCGYLLDRLEKRELRRLLFCATGALLSPTSSWQGESIPGVCHAVAITAEGV